jgi:hypothetical protein
MRDRAARCVLGIPQKRPQPCIHAALRTIARFHPVQQTRIQTAPRTVGERSQLFRRRRPAALLTEWRFSKFHPSASQQRARPIDKISAQDETLRGGGAAFEISIDHGHGLLSAKRRVLSDSRTRAAQCPGKVWTLPSAGCSSNSKPRRAGIVTHLSQGAG